MTKRKPLAQQDADPGAVDSVEKAYNAFLSAQEQKRESEAASPNGAILQVYAEITPAEYDMIVAMRDALRAYHQPAEHPREPFPSEMAFYLQVLLTNALAGVKRTPSGLTRRGAGRDNYDLNRDKDAAARYLWAVAEGIIVDTSYNQTIQECFDVDESTVRGWRDRPLPPLQARLSALSRDGQRAAITLLMRKAGEHYKRHGRSQSAISSRGKTRS